MRKGSRRAECVHTNVTVYKPIVRGSTDCTTDSHKTVLLRAHEQRRRRGICLQCSDERVAFVLKGGDVLQAHYY